MSSISGPSQGANFETPKSPGRSGGKENTRQESVRMRAIRNLGLEVDKSGLLFKPEEKKPEIRRTASKLTSENRLSTKTRGRMSPVPTAGSPLRDITRTPPRQARDKLVIVESEDSESEVLPKKAPGRSAPGPSSSGAVRVAGSSSDDESGDDLGLPPAGSSSGFPVRERDFTESEDAAFGVVSRGRSQSIPKRKLSKKKKAQFREQELTRQKEWQRASNRLLRSSIVGQEQAEDILKETIAGGLPLVSSETGIKVTEGRPYHRNIQLEAARKKGEKFVAKPEEPVKGTKSKKKIAAAEQEKLEESIAKGVDIAYAQLMKIDARKAIRFASQKSFENNELDASRIRQVALHCTAGPGLKEQLYAHRSEITGKIASLTNHNPVAWFRAEYPDLEVEANTVAKFWTTLTRLNDDQLAVRTEINLLEGATILFRALKEREVIDEEKGESELGSIRSLEHHINEYKAEGYEIERRSILQLANLVNELISTERSHIKPLKVFLKKKFGESGNRTFFGALKERGIITEDRQRYFEKNLNALIAGSDAIFKDLKRIKVPGAENLLTAEGYPQLAESLIIRLGEITELMNPKALYELTQTLSTLARVKEEWSAMLAKLDELEPRGTIQRQFTEFEGHNRRAQDIIIFPVQRSPRYNMMLTEALKHFDKLRIDAACATFKERADCLFELTKWVDYKSV